MTAREPAAGEAVPGRELPSNADAPAANADAPAASGDESGQPRYEPAPGVGKLLLWVLLFVLAAVVVVVGGVYFG
ncbi:hypothetical protein OG788_18965 [Streptomyces sp. NBC_00647]|uniref:hypothetical protein n=1 Tax=Streptomyces sp. NBC_00647 TaxID=2975796 RepID=UPI00324738A1